MDYEAEFAKTVAATIALLKTRGKAPQTFAAKGEEISGWSIGTDSHDSMKGSPGTSYWEEYWDRADIVMAEDGSFWKIGFWATQGTAGSERQEFRNRLQLSYFVGSEGTPFATWKAKLERLPYL